MASLRLTVWSDYLCPWCFNASVRLEKLSRELGGELAIDWRAYLLRPQPRPAGEGPRELERFVRYTQSWLRPAAEPDAGSFRVWESSAGPPSHSVPAHLAAKAARRLGSEAFAALHARLLRAYFAENRDVSQRATLEAVWQEAGLPPGEFGASTTPRCCARCWRSTPTRWSRA